MIDPEKVRSRVATLLKVPVERVTDAAPVASLVHDSFLLVQLVIDLQEEFGARLVQEDLARVVTVGDLLHEVVTHEMA